MSKCWCGSESAEGVCFGSIYHDPNATGRPAEIERVYIAGPMTGYPDNNYAAFNYAALRLRSRGYTVTNPAEYGVPEFGKRVSYTDLLRQDLLEMLKCDAVATLDRWWESTGARNEVMVAGVLRMPVRSLEEWLDAYRR